MHMFIVANEYRINMPEFEPNLPLPGKLQLWYLNALAQFGRVVTRKLSQCLHEHQAEGRACPAYFTPSAPGNH
jgi:hypothetical protein